jgi:hypothetical protein
MSSSVDAALRKVARQKCARVDTERRNMTLSQRTQLGVTVCAAAVWILGVSRDRVRAAAIAHAARLVAACEALADRPSLAGVSGSKAAKLNLGGAGAGQTLHPALWNRRAGQIFRRSYRLSQAANRRRTKSKVDGLRYDD